MINELPDRWVLGLRGSRVKAVSRGKDLRVGLDTGVDITVGGNALLTVGPAAAPDAVLLQVSEASDHQLDGLVGARVLSSVAFKSGALRIVFDTGHHLSVRSAGPAVTAEVLKPGSFVWSYSDEGVKMKLLNSST
jgi:hypothetical protein